MPLLGCLVRAQKQVKVTPERVEPGLGHFLALQQSIGNRAVQRLLIRHAPVMRQGEEVKGGEASADVAADKQQIPHPEWRQLGLRVPG